MKRRWGMGFALAALLLMGWQDASGYAHFVRYLTKNGPFEPVLTRFDLRSVPGKRIPYFIERRGPEQLAEGDSRVALFSQIQAAAEVWNTVKTSELRVVFGGLIEAGARMNGPRVEIVFDEVPPGLVALAGPEVLGEVTEKDGTVFVPIVKSLLILPDNMADPARPSWSERLFQTIVHEFGHTLGLQHSWASGTMSTEITRATTKGAPLAADDVAGISALYPTREFVEKTGSIAGRVLMGGQGVHLASVVALKPTGEAVSALTAPDGRYVIRGLAPGSYSVYAHPLPPGLAGEPQPVNLDLPLGPDGPIQPGGAFDLAFFPGGSVPEHRVDVREGETNGSVWFSVQPRQQVNLHSVQTYRFFGQQAVKPAFLQAGQERGSIVLFGFGMSNASGPVAGLSATLFQAPETLLAPGIFAYAPAPSYLQTDLSVPEDAPPGLRHMLFRLNGETHVAPGAYKVTQAQPPAVEVVEPAVNGIVTIRGKRLDRGARVLFDGAAGQIAEGSAEMLQVRPPRGMDGHAARVSVFDSEGQSSAMLDGGTAHVHRYENGGTPAWRVEPAFLPAGVETVLELTSEGADWTPAKLGFGTSDVTVSKIWRVGAHRSLVKVAVSPAAEAGPLRLALADGIAFAEAENALNIYPPSVRKLYVVMSAMADTPVYAGGMAALPVANLTSPLFLATTQVRINGVAAPVVAVNGSVATVQIPEGLPAGVVKLQMTVQGEEVLPAALVLSLPPPKPPVITAAQTLMGLNLQAGMPPAAGEMIQLLVTGLAESAATEDVKSFSGEVEHTVILVQKTATGHTVYVRLSEESPRGAAIPLTLRVDGLQSLPFPVPIR
ncbi:MAG: matrixin family metalloprotease [Bryobacteraceae bacterium]|nr:matrixin family metalloprotease [Bryobacteraceae bacterium]